MGRPPVDPGERPGTDTSTQAFVLALVPTLTLSFAQEKVRELFQQNPIYGLTPSTNSARHPGPKARDASAQARASPRAPAWVRRPQTPKL